MWSRSLRNKKKEEGFTGAQQVYDCALDLLSYRDYSHKDMVERLQRKGATKAQALEAVAKLEDYGLLNEERYALRVYEAWLGKRYYGRQHLQLELTKRGIRRTWLRKSWNALRLTLKSSRRRMQRSFSCSAISAS